MRTIIAGSRDVTNYNELIKAIQECTWKPTTVLCGLARGVDMLGERWAKENDIDVEYYIANWNKYGKKAGYVRNEEMAKNADALIALWDGKSRGTAHMVDLACEYGLDIFVQRVYITDVDNKPR